MKNLVHCSISGFQPVNGTPLQKCETTSIATFAKFVSIARLVLPEKDISACGLAGSLDSLPLMLIAGANRAYLGAYVCRARTEKGFVDELDEVFRPSYESRIEEGWNFYNCRNLGKRELFVEP